MDYFSGRHGSLIYLGKPVAKVRNWSLTTSIELIETTKVDEFAPTYRPGMKSATGSASIFYHRPEYGGRTTGFLQLVKRVIRVGEISEIDKVELELAIGTKTADKLLVDAYVTRVALGSTIGEVSSCEMDFTVTGDIKRTLLTFDLT